MSAGRRSRPAEQRLRRLLVLLPWLMERGEVTVSEAASRFGLSEDEVAKDLELVAMCGLPPFVDELIDVFIDDGMIWVGVPRLFTRPLRLNSVEAFELLAAGRAAMELPGADPEGPLGRGLAKLARALGDHVESDVHIELDRPERADVLAEAARASAELRIEYRSADRDQVSARTIVPRQVFTDRGEWYVTAADDLSGEIRIFRVDRIESLTPTGRSVEPDDSPLPEPGVWFADGSVPRATIRLAPAAQWVVERYPVDAVSEPDDVGWVTATMAVASERWLERTLVRLGPHARVIDPPELRDVGRRVADRVIERYRS